MPKSACMYNMEDKTVKHLLCNSAWCEGGKTKKIILHQNNIVTLNGQAVLALLDSGMLLKVPCAMKCKHYPTIFLCYRRNPGEEAKIELDTCVTATDFMLAHLDPVQTAKLHQVFKEIPSLFAASFWKITLMEYVIHLKDERPIHQSLYHVPQSTWHWGSI